MIEMRKLRELVKLMKDNDLVELDLRDDTEQVTLRRPGPAAPVMQAQPMAPAPVAPTAAPAPAQPTAEAEKPAEGGVPAGMVEIKSPMVGTFYSSPSPDADPFVRQGAKVNADTVVCVVEAMKVFNEIKAETSGTIERVLVDNGQAVEFDQPLFLVKPN
jgi:acetyl-CoA carboxylase biotin carboxyl carrier protein